MRARVRAAAGLVVAALVVASCSDGEVPDTLPDVAPTSAATAEALSPTPTGDPTAALEAEITAFFEEYIEASNASWTSKEALDRRRQMFADSCSACLFGYEIAQRAHMEDLTFEGELGSVDRVRLDSIDGDVIRFSGFTSTPAARLVDSAGAVIKEFPSTESLQVAYQVQRLNSGEWIMINSEVLG
jgi:hypothetical protein